MMNDIIKNTEERMEQYFKSFNTQMKKIYIGRISPNILDNIKIHYSKDNKESSTPIRYLANIVTENSRTLIITVFDTKTVKNIEKSIIQSNLKVSTSSQGNIIRVYSPILTEERRKDLIKLTHVEAEKTKISIRNIRRASYDKIKILMKNKKITEDKEYDLQNKIQKLTNEWMKKINESVKNKEIELKNT